MTTAVIFGSNSWLAKHFIQNSAGDFSDVVAIARASISSNVLVDKAFSLSLDGPLTTQEFSLLSSALRDKSDLVFFLFAWAGTPRTSIGPHSADIFSSNIWITSNYLRLIEALLPSQVIFISSAGAVYPHFASDQRDYSETSTTSPNTSYGSQKLSCESDLLRLCEELGIPCASLRISTAYGHNPLVPDQGVANLWLYSALNDKPLKIYNSLDSLINFVADYQISAAISAVARERLHGIYNLGSLQSTPLSDLLAEIKSIFYPKTIETRVIGDEVRLVSVDSRKLYEAIGFTLKSNIVSDLQALLFAFTRGQ